MSEYKALEQELIECFKKRNITVEKLSVSVDTYDGTYKIKVKYPKTHHLHFEKHNDK